MKQAFRKFDTAQAPYSPALTIVICVDISPFFNRCFIHCWAGQTSPYSVLPRRGRRRRPQW
jgi:hypothetical protein